jgi:hypothetical protein
LVPAGRPRPVQRLLAGQLLGSQPPVGIVLEIEMGARAAVRELDLIAAAVGDDFVLDQSDGYPAILAVNAP